MRMRALRVGLHSHSNRLLVSMAGLVFLTALIMSLIALNLSRVRLAEQREIQLEVTKSAVNSLLLAEQSRIANQLSLFGERPTLQGLLQAQQARALELYIQDFRSQSGLDFLAVYRADGVLLASNGRLNSYSASAGHGFLLDAGRPLLAAQQIIRSPGSDLPLGTAVAGVWLERPFLDRIANVAGAELQLRPSAAAVDQQAGALPLTNSTGQITLFVELALPNAELITAQTLLWPMAMSTAVLTLIGLLISVLLVRRQTASLQKLTAAAQQIAQGDVTAPLPLVTEPAEMRQMATALHRLQAQLITAQRQMPLDAIVEAFALQEVPAGGDLRTAPDLLFDISRLEVQRSDQDPVRLTPLEARLLDVLMRHPGQVLHSDVLITAVWGSDGGDRTMLKQLIYRLRSKIDPDSREPSLIETISGVGYAFKS